MELKLNMLQEQYLKRLILKEIQGENSVDSIGQQILHQMEYRKALRKRSNEIFRKKLKNINFDDDKR